MITHTVLFAFQLIVELPEIIISLLVALALGFSIHFFWISKRSMRFDDTRGTETLNDNDNWKLKYYNDMDMQERAQEQLRERLAETKENEQILAIEVEEMRKEIDELSYIRTEALEASKKPVVAPEPASDYMSQLKSAQENLVEHNNSISRLLAQIDLLKASERKNAESLKANELLTAQLSDARKSLAERDEEISHVRQQLRLSSEIAERLDKAYAEYNVLQEKLQKLDNYLLQPHKSNEYAELRESYFKLTKDFDEVKSRQNSLWDENQRLSRILSDTEDKLREANFQRQQLQKKVSFMEELNGDLQQVSEHNKKLESQFRRISEMEALLAKATSEKNDLQDDPSK